MKFTIPGRPVTKKNSQQLIRTGGRIIPIPSKKYRQYERDAGPYVPSHYALMQGPLNIKALYYMPDRRNVDLLNLLEATCDILTHYGVIEDDNSKIVAAHDGSRVLYDKENPRAEIEITMMEGENEPCMDRG